MATLTAKKLIVNTYELNSENTGSFEVYKFENGLILVPGENTNDWYFEDCDSVVGCGNDCVESIEETESVSEWTVDELKKSIEGSVREFGEDSIPQKAYELLS